jgi:hypothetical protein
MPMKLAFLSIGAFGAVDQELIRKNQGDCAINVMSR